MTRLERVCVAASMAMLVGAGGQSVLAHEGRGRMHEQVIVPEEDRFTPFSLTIRAGDSVEWINEDTDDHTVVSDDFFNSAGNEGTNHILPGTENNGGQPSTFVLRFKHPGTFVYFCRFHAQLDAAHQPTAPGPDGGIQDPETGNFGTPMMGVITVLSDDDNDD